MIEKNVDSVNHVAIVGGGTAGWLAASILAKQLNAKGSDGSVRISLIESPDIPTIGVGEGTWPTMRKTLQKLGVDEGDFMRSCSATFKQGTRFIDWVSSKESSSYSHLFCSVVNPADFNLAPYWLLSEELQKSSYLDAVSAQGRVCELGLAPKKITSKAYEAPQSYGYHFDAGKFVEFIRTFAVDTLGVVHHWANVESVNLAGDGSIESVSTDAVGLVEADLFVDCTGFSSLLLGGTYGIGFNKLDDTLFTDGAVTLQVPYATADAPIPSNTLSTAHEAGWIWDIGLRDRRGTGCVYSSRYMSSDEAEAKLRSYIGGEAQDLTARHIKMNTGCREKFWHKNCLAIGLSAAFIEPLEASAIFLIEAAANMLADQFPRHKASMPLVEKKFNRSFEFRWRRTIEFIKLHYYLSKRQEPFWLDNKKVESVPPALLESLQHWKRHPVSAYDFSDVYEPFAQESYQFVLYGMGFDQELEYNRASYFKDAEAREYFRRAKLLTEHMVKELPTNRDLIEKVYKFGFQSI